MKQFITTILSAVLVLAGCKEKTVTVETPSGTVSWTKKNTGKKSFEDHVENLSPAELSHLVDDAAKADAFIDTYARPLRTNDLLENLDVAFARWMTSENTNLYSKQAVIDVVGAALGEYCIRKLGMHWARVTDKYGTTIALVLDNPEARSYPFTSIEYRIEDKKTNFITALYIAVDQTIKNGRTGKANLNGIP